MPLPIELCGYDTLDVVIVSRRGIVEDVDTDPTVAALIRSIEAGWEYRGYQDERSAALRWLEQF
jgi:hypothetical protein